MISVTCGYTQQDNLPWKIPHETVTINSRVIIIVCCKGRSHNVAGCTMLHNAATLLWYTAFNGS